MTVARGCSGKVYCSATGGTTAQVAEVQEWSFESTSEALDASEMGACVKKFVAGPVQTSGSITVNWDLSDAEQVLLGAIGTNVKLDLFPDGNGTGKKAYKSPSVLVNSVRHGGSVNGFVQSTFSFFVNGAMTTTTVP